MQLAKTVILKILGGDGELGKLLSAFSEGMNYASGIIFENGKPMGSGRVQKASYRYLRNTLGLKSQMCCNVARQVAGAYKTLQDQVLFGQAEWQKLSFERDFGFHEDHLSITTLAGRKKYKIQVYRHAEKFFDGTWKYSASKPCLHKNGSYFFHLACEKEIPDKPITEASTFMGVDAGMNCLAVASTTDMKCKFFAGGEIKSHRNMYWKERRRLQKAGGRYLGTRSSMRVLKNLSGRETRFMTAVNHVISRRLIEFALDNDVSAIGMEDLTEIRERASVPKDFRYEHSSWAFRQLQTFI